ncbi:hypothetical protein E1180_01045 [Roseibium denhamense]|uniref:Allene oxide cyclase barrel-like domain-containing protein n=1 Tax=Roseibium denhamense TaxID=76305 RepID=A0ABY1PK63_9HYPH|nr:hypothetical protein [Roseibium denhamense]MTI04102.1 hypothetical protein [Roseibium denhamense]SMP33636.1 hypothetical protein SAMN06265374_3796 [Roseibium denhamense]
MTLAKTFATATLAAIAFGTGSANALEICEPFSVTAPLNETRTVQLIAQDSGDARAGDLRIGHNALLDEDGQEIGTIDWQTKVLAGSESGEIRLASDVIMNLEGGNLYARSGAYTIPDPVLDPKTRTISNDQVRDIIGGSGAFERAIGAITFSMQENGDAKLNVDVSCT